MSSIDRSYAEIISMAGEVDLVHTLYYLMIKAWTSSFGLSEFWLRTPSALAMAVATAFVTATAMLLNPKRRIAAGVVAPIIFVGMAGVSFFGIDARGYAFGVLCAAVALHTTLKRYETHRTSWNIVLLLALLLGTGFMLYVCLTAAAVLLYDTIRNRRFSFGYSWSAILAAVLAIPFIYESSTQSGQISWLAIAGVRQPEGPLFESLFVGYHGFLGALPTTQVTMAEVGGLIIWLLVFAGLYAAKDAATRMLLVSWWLIPHAVVLVYSAVVSQIYTPRYLVFVAPAVCVAAATGAIATFKARSVAIILAGYVALMVPIFDAHRQVDAKDSENSRAVSQFRTGTDYTIFVDGHARASEAAYPVAESEDYWLGERKEQANAIFDHSTPYDVNNFPRGATFVIVGFDWDQKSVSDIADKAVSESCVVVDDLRQPRHYAKKVDCTMVLATP